MAASENFYDSPLSPIIHSSSDKQTLAQKHHGDIKFRILESFPFQQDKL
jgi:hypothetical protein